jgi:aldose 1-epimerase
MTTLFSSAHSELLTLTAGELVVAIAPSVGGSLAAFYSMRDGQRHDWLRPASEQALRDCEPEGMASFPLVPFCNRIRHGRASCDGKAIVMAPNRGTSPHTIHGTAWQQPWSVLRCDGHSATLAFDDQGTNWPYRFSALQHIALRNDSLTVTMEVENRDTQSMPLGVGHHPYLPHRPGTRLQVDVEQMWLGDAEVMPTGLERNAVVEQLCAGVLLADLVLDNNFVGWDHTARVEWPATDGRQTGSALTLRAVSPLDFFVLYSPRADHFCIEPVSNCTDWLNLRQQYSAQQVGGTVLAPGDTYRASFSLHPEWLDR